MSQETASKADHSVVWPEGRTTGAIKANGSPGPKDRLQALTCPLAPTFHLRLSSPGFLYLSVWGEMEGGMGRPCKNETIK